MSFLPEDDLEFLEAKGAKYNLSTERVDGNERRGVFFLEFPVGSNLRTVRDGALVPCENCELLLLVPDGYSTSRLDSFYTFPRMRRPDGSDPQNANTEAFLFGKSWQFWSRHLGEQDWRVGVDGLRTFLSYVRGELRAA